MRVIVTSVKDPASQNIKQVLIDEYGFHSNGEIFEGNEIYTHEPDSILITSERDLIRCDHLDEHFDAEVFIFCSRHRSKSAKPALLVHSTGNYLSDDSFGGQPYELSISTASLVSTAYKRLFSERNHRNLSEFDVSLEVTHHGPTSMKTPLLFVELGSDEEYWEHPEGAKAVAAAAIDCLTVSMNKGASIAFGGNHYASKFNRLVLEENIHISHMAPKYVLDEINQDLVSQMVNRTHESVNQAILDWKGTTSDQRDRIIPMIESLGIEIIRAKELKSD
ncbi:MAG: D-aminoacyl-tRNA deacylase [Candidatus Thorarchaeota archaeon]|nr:MAG: D-aminoacyl-tRNA deacylase [Candidatus Thorarchaeota archaeon]